MQHGIERPNVLLIRLLPFALDKTAVFSCVWIRPFLWCRTNARPIVILSLNSSTLSAPSWTASTRIVILSRLRRDSPPKGPDSLPATAHHQDAHNIQLPHGCLWWAHQDSNLEPKDYEFVVDAPCLEKSIVRQRKQQNKKVSCDSSLAQLGEDGQNSALYRLSTAIGNDLEPVDVHDDGSHGLTTVTPVGWKSAALRVTTAIPCTRAVAAMSASRSPRLSGTCSRAQRCATAVSIGNIRP